MRKKELPFVFRGFSPMTKLVRVVYGDGFDVAAEEVVSTGKPFSLFSHDSLAGCRFVADCSIFGGYWVDDKTGDTYELR